MKKLTKKILASLFVVGLLSSCGEKPQEPQEPQPIPCTVTYDGNGSTSGDVPVDDKTYYVGDEATVLSEGDLAKDDLYFAGWNTLSDGTGVNYLSGEKITLESSITLFAQWGTWDEVINIISGKQANFTALNGIKTFVEREDVYSDITVFDADGTKVVAINMCGLFEYEGDYYPITSTLKDPFLGELFESKDWAAVSVDFSAESLGGISGVMLSRPNDIAHNFITLEFQYVEEDSLISMIAGDPMITMYIYVTDGVSVEEASALLTEGVELLGCDDPFLNGDQLVELGNTFLVRPNFDDSVGSFYDSFIAKLDENNLRAHVELDYNLEMDLLQFTIKAENENKAISKVAELFKLVNLKCDSNWMDVSDLGLGTCKAALISVKDNYEGMALIFKDRLGVYTVKLFVECINSQLYKLENFVLSSFSYDIEDNPVTKFTSQINSENFDIIDDYQNTLGMYAIAKNASATTGKVVNVNYYESNGLFNIGVNKSDPIIKAWPVDTIAKLSTSKFSQTTIPTIDLPTIALAVDGTEELGEPYVAVVAFDPTDLSADGAKSLRTLLEEQFNEATGVWELYYADDEYSKYKSVEVNPNGEALMVEISEFNNQLVVTFDLKQVVASFEQLSDKINGFVNYLGFSSVTIPAAPGGEIWDASWYYNAQFSNFGISASDPTGELVDQYKALFGSDWNVYETLVEDAGYNEGFKAHLKQPNKYGELLEVEVYFDDFNEETIIYYEISEVSEACPVDAINDFTATLGFTDSPFVTLTGDYFVSNDESSFKLISYTNGTAILNELATKLDPSKWNVTVNDGNTALTAYSKEMSASEDGFSKGLCISAFTNGNYFEMEITLSAYFPVTAINDIFKKQGWGENVLPVSLLENVPVDPVESLISYDEEYDSYYIYIWIEVCENPSEILSAFVTGLTALGCEYDDSGADWGDYYLSTEYFDIYCYISDWSSFGETPLEISLTVYPKPTVTE